MVFNPRETAQRRCPGGIGGGSGKMNRGERDKAGTGGISGWGNLKQNTKVRALKSIIWQLLTQIGVKEK